MKSVHALKIMDDLERPVFLNTKYYKIIQESTMKQKFSRTRILF